MITKLVCYFKGHVWCRLNGLAVYSHHNLPYPDAYCSRCGTPAQRYMQRWRLL